MTAPTIYVVVRRDRDVGDSVVGWCFFEPEARDAARRLNGGGEWGPHVVEEVAPLETP